MRDRQELRAEVVGFLNEVAKLGSQADGIADDVNLIDAGIIDSLALMEIVAYLEERHGLDFLELGFEPDELATIDGILSAILRTSA